MTFERTRDAEAVKRIFCVPEIWENSSDDSCGDPDGLEVRVDSPVWYVLARDGEDLLGMWVLIPMEGESWEVHTCLLPGRGLSVKRKAAQEMLRWIWDHVPCQRLVTQVPSFNRPARLFAMALGMREYGVDRESFVKNGRSYDQALFEIFRPGEEPCQLSRPQLQQAQPSPAL